MPLYEGISLSSEKTPVVFDFGHAYTKCGFAGENGPRCVILSEVRRSKTGKTVKLYDLSEADDLYGALVDFIHFLYFRHLLINPKERRVVIVESFLCTTKFRNLLAKVFFKHFEVPSILFAASHLMAALTLGVPSCLVMDCGFDETIVLPVYEGIALLKAYQVLPIAGKTIHERLEAQLCEHATIKVGPHEEVSASSVKESLTSEVLEDIKVRTCFVTKLERAKVINSTNDLPPPPGVEYPLGGSKLMTIDGKIRETACEVLFEQDADEVSVATLILDSLLKCPIDTRRKLAENILLVGGTVMLPGFKRRLVTELHELKTLPKYKERLAIETFMFHTPPAKENYAAWLGGAIFGSLEIVHIRSVGREQYLKGCSIPDWCSLLEAEEAEERSILTKVASVVKIEAS
jgi:actin-related protein 10